ncbi:MAG: DUF4864 domain-containing protein [Roseovarius sp.]
MRALVLTLMLSLALALPVRADGARAVIEAQIEAFRVGDLARAYRFASPMIQQKFGTPEVFGRMVEQGYPMVWRPSEVIFLEAREIGDRLWQEVFLRDMAGRGWIADYEMIEENGTLRVNGVHLREAPESTVRARGIVTVA